MQVIYQRIFVPLESDPMSNLIDNPVIAEYLSAVKRKMFDLAAICQLLLALPSVLLFTSLISFYW